MRSTTFLLASSLAFTIAAAAHQHRHHALPHQKRGEHVHQAVHEKRDVVWVTDWNTVFETVGITETIWVSSGFIPPTTSTTTHTSATPIAAQFFEPIKSSTPSPTTLRTEASSSSSVYVAPVPVSTFTPQTTSTAAPVLVEPSVVPAAVKSIVSQAPAEASTSSASVAPVVVPTVVPTTTTSNVETTTQATSAAAVSTVQAASAISNVVASTTGTCQGASNPCTGDATYYDVDASEYTSCGDQVDGLTTNIVAIAADFMGAQSNGNPMCGKTISVSYKGTTIQATVCDKCPGCTGRGIDLSRAAFQSIASFDIGRIKSGDITWWFN